MTPNRKKLEDEFTRLHDFLAAECRKGLALLKMCHPDLCTLGKREAAEGRGTVSEPSRGTGTLREPQRDTVVHLPQELTREACCDSALLTLARLVDDHKDAVTVYTFRKFVENHPHLFRGERRDVLERAKRFPPSEHEDVIRKIRQLRDTRYAHNDKKFCTAEGKEFDPVPVEILEGLYRSILSRLLTFRSLFLFHDDK